MIKEKKTKMNSTVWYFSLLILCCVHLNHAVDGIAVTNRSSEGIKNWGLHGDIWRYDISKNTVVDSARLFEGFAHWPTINPSGTHIAFLRRDESRHFVSAIPIEGGTPTDLYEITGTDNTSRGMCAWDTDNTIYFNKSSGGNEIFTVNINGSDYRKIATIPTTTWIRCWDINCTADRLIIQSKKQGVFLLDFPGCNIVPFEGPGTCNSAISASGDFVSGINTAGHTAQNIAQWQGKKVYTLQNDSMALWGGYTRDLRGMDKTNWSCNSDKWICVRLGWPGPNGGRFSKQGTNQVIVNWVEKRAIRTTLNSPPPDTIDGTVWRWFSEAGDFWVAGLDGKIERVGDQASIPSQSENPVRHTIPVRIHQNDITIAMSRRHAVRIRIYDIAGTTVFQNKTSRVVTIPTDGFSSGTYFIEASDEVRGITSTFLLAR